MSGEMGIRWAGKGDFPAVQALWHEGFPADSDEDVAAFWQAVSGVGRCLLLTEGDAPISMAFLLPAFARTAQRRRSLWYVYAAATRRDRRGQGCFRRLLDEAAVRAVESGEEALFLRPAEPSLFNYYARCGFRPLCRAAEIEWQVNDLVSNFLPDELQLVESGYADRRQMWLDRLGVPYVQWPPAVADYAVRLAQETGGGAVCSPFGAALCERDGDRLLVRELLCVATDRRRMAAALARQFPCQAVAINAPPLGADKGTAFGMIRPCKTAEWDETPLYMGLTLE